MKFSVWAPAAGRVELMVAGRSIGMARDDRGWWHAAAPAAHGDDYTFSVDEGRPRPDPRSAHQPRGVHGPSRVVDHARFDWQHEGFRPPPLSSAVVYELHVGVFTPEGTFDAAIARLDHLVALGVDFVELMPVAEFPGSRGWGYDGVALYAPHHAYGGPEGLKRFVDACHGRGLGVLIDVVYNHLGPSGNYLREFGPYFTDRYVTPWGEAVNMDGPYSDDVRSFFIDNALMWLRDYRCDGLRLDAVHAIVDTSAVHFLEELAVRVHALEARLARNLHLVAESNLNDPRLVRRRDAGGYGLHAQWNDDFHHALHALLTGESAGYYSDFGRMGDLAAALTRAFVYDGRYSKHLKRRHGRRPEGVSGHRFLGYLQNHDQVGNRAAGERLSQLVDTDLLKVGAALLLTSPFVPMLFTGEEWGATTPFQYFTDHEEKDVARTVGEGRRREFAAFGWDPRDVPDPQDPATFERSKLDWSEPERPEHADLLDWYRRAIRLRRALPTLADGALHEVRARNGEPGWLVVERGPVTIACNLSDSPAAVPLRRAPGELLLSSSGSLARKTPPAGEVDLAPRSVAVWSSG
ncbi:MAG: malto-oligosyltrehalose trehalohydrolase [Actinomycetota bacterium]